MRTLLSERFAPITSRIGFVRAPLEDVLVGMLEWKAEFDRVVRVTRPMELFPEVFHLLEPLTQGFRPRQLLVPVGAEWTAYFDCSQMGTDPLGPVTTMASKLQCLGLYVGCSPQTISKKSPRGRWGNVRFSVIGPLPGPRRSVRSVQAMNDGGRWVFDVSGEPLPFEETEQYEAVRKRDRFTSDMLERYCQAMGVDVFNPAAYGPEAVLLETDGLGAPRNHVLRTLAETQDDRRIIPGQADSMPG